jgi:hypothetical protein
MYHALLHETVLEPCVHVCAVPKCGHDGVAFFLIKDCLSFVEKNIMALLVHAV